MGKRFRATMEQQRDYERRYGFLDDPLHFSPPVAVVPGRPGRLCSVCTHEDRKGIEELVRTESIRAVAKQFGLNYSSMQRHIANHAPELRSRGPAEVTEQAFKEPVVTEGPVGLFVAKKECIGLTRIHYYEGDLEIWPLDLEIGHCWQRVGAAEELDPRDAGKGKYRQKTGRWRTASIGVQIQEGIRALRAADVEKMQKQVIKDVLEKKRAAMDFRPIYWKGVPYCP